MTTSYQYWTTVNSKYSNKLNLKVKDVFESERCFIYSYTIVTMEIAM